MTQQHLDIIAEALTTPSFTEPYQREVRDELGALRIERWMPDVGLLVFEHAGPGQWLTRAGSPAKRAKRSYTFNPLDAPPTELVSVTTVLDVLAKPALISWAEDRGARGAIEAHRLGEIPEDLPPEEIVGRVRLLGLGADAEKKRAADRGLDEHDALETWARTGSLPPITDMAPDRRAFRQGLDAALTALDPEPIVTERIVCHPSLGYAGRFDLRCLIDGKDTLLDLKTSQGGKPYLEAHAQLVGYAMAEEAVGEPYPESLIALGVSAEGEFCAVESVASREDWLSILGCFRAVCGVREAMKAAA